MKTETVIQDRHFTFDQFIVYLAKLSNGETIEKLLVVNCIIEGIPEGFKVLGYKNPKKFLGLTIVTFNDKFFGFEVKSCTVMGNMFKNVTKKVKTLPKK